MKRIEAGRRHGHYDPRFWTEPVTHPRDPDSREGFDVWENEGGPSQREPILAARPTRPEWHAFSRRYFPNRRRHDLQALTAWRDTTTQPTDGASSRTARTG